MAEKKNVRILLAEDDPDLGSLLQEFLESRSYQAVLVENGREALDRLGEEPFDLCLLDVMMPIKDGFSVARDLREKRNNIPIIFLTARSMKEDTLEGFRSGADDYISKPFSMDELLARVQAVLRRSELQPGTDRQYKIGEYSFDPIRELLSRKGEEKKLTTREAALLKLLCENKNQVLDRGEALLDIWGDDSYFNSRSMDVYITRLRKYLKEDPQVQILNVHGKGFRLLVSTGG